MRFRPMFDEEDGNSDVAAMTSGQVERVYPCDLEEEEIREWERSGERRPGWYTCAYCGRLFEVYWE